jgi:hypothetical protein
MIVAPLLFWGAAAAGIPAAAAAVPDLYRIELAGNAIVWSQDRPQQTGASVVFHRYPDGLLMSVKSSDVRRLSLSKLQRPASKELAPGEKIDIGVTGTGAGASGMVSAAAAPRGKVAAPAPGERKDGTALLNPDRPYRPDWDSKQVPGMNIPYPASPNDYREGRTMAYPSASGVQAAPGDVPRARVETGEPPKASNQ